MADTPTDQTQALLPCPFCGGSPKRETCSRRYKHHAAVECACGASLRTFIYVETQAEVDVRWNTRNAPPAASDEEPSAEDVDRRRRLWRNDAIFHATVRNLLEFRAERRRSPEWAKDIDAMAEEIERAAISAMRKDKP